MAVSLYGIDEPNVEVDPAVVASISEIYIGGRVCTRINMQSGDDIVVLEPELIVRALLSGDNS